MKGKILCALLLIIGMGVTGCGAPEPPMACFDGEFPWWDWDEDFAAAHHDFEYCEHFDMVCNDAVTLASECPEFMAELVQFLQDEVVPWASDWMDFLPWLDLDGFLTWAVDMLQGSCGFIDILDQVGTCQLPGGVDFPCAEDADCLEGLLCAGGVCA